LAQKSGETVELELHVGVGDNIGLRYPAYATSTGKPLAGLSNAELKATLHPQAGLRAT